MFTFLPVSFLKDRVTAYKNKKTNANIKRLQKVACLGLQKGGFWVKNMDGMVRKMERYVNSTTNLYYELGVLNEIQQAQKKFQNNQHEENRKAFDQKLMWRN
ncbi:hypothetical protein HYC85_001031 [Camellia sinensis]|uniref:Uncharacterized protein n=1 Tax=Camellia sinensis TaxID=4442 RepID=A0A7J7I466_CAMSI|nr:hypothetical protein HYC85_001031 [Camellia sinensis]